ncbi:hypothetical protein HZA57_02030 [Candidatus Poribacteria bacterium]|nr:hypothetical protein [Candidatus Poribacteria bacterium]
MRDAAKTNTINFFKEVLAGGVGHGTCGATRWRSSVRRKGRIDADNQGRSMTVMCHEVSALYLTAATIGLDHTLMGPDHCIPFIAMSRAGLGLLRWHRAERYAHVFAGSLILASGVAVKMGL